MNSAPPDPPPGCCRSFWDKILCCRSQQKIASRRSSQMILGDEMETTKCCFCIPCKRKRRPSMAWSEDRQTSNSSQSLPPQSFARRMFQNICCCYCCRRKNDLDSRRTSLQSKKASLDGRPKVSIKSSAIRGFNPFAPFIAGETKTGPCPSRAQFDDEGSFTCTPHLSGLLLSHPEHPPAWPGNASLWLSLRVLREAQVLANGRSQAQIGIPADQYNCGSLTGVLCDLLSGRLGLVHLVGIDSAENCT